MRVKKIKKRELLENIEDNALISSIKMICDHDIRMIETHMDNMDQTSKKISTIYQNILEECDHVGGALAEVSTILNDRIVYHQLEEKFNDGTFGISIEATIVMNKVKILDNRQENENDNLDIRLNVDKLSDQAFEQVQARSFNVDPTDAI